METITRTTRQDIQQQLNTGKVICRQVEEPVYNDFFEENTYGVIFQQKITNPGANPLLNMFLGFDNSSYPTVYQNMVESKFNELTKKPEVGLTADEITGLKDLNIQIQEGFEPFYPNQEAKKTPLNEDGTGGTILCFEGKPIYRQTTLVVGEPNHVLVQHDGSSPQPLEERTFAG